MNYLCKKISDDGSNSTQQSFAWNHPENGFGEIIRPLRMGIDGLLHQHQLFYRKSQHAIEPEIPAQNPVGPEKSGGTLFGTRGKGTQETILNASPTSTCFLKADKKSSLCYRCDSQSIAGQNQTLINTNSLF